MSLSVSDYMLLRGLEERFPVAFFYEEDRRAVLKYALAMCTAGIPNDSDREQDVLIEMILECAFRRAYCNKVSYLMRGTSDICSLGEYAKWREAQEAGEISNGEA